MGSLVAREVTAPAPAGAATVIMKTARIPADEEARLRTLFDYDVLDTEAEESLDDLTRLASAICGTPISLISLVDRGRQWFKSRVGLDATSTSRDLAFCAHAILESGIFEVPDTLEDERFRDNPLVLDDPNIRFYAGTPLVSPDGHAIGTLCVISDQAKTLTAHQRTALEILGKQVIMQLELRKKSRAQELANQSKSDFLSSISHDLRTPLNAIVGFSDLLAENPDTYFRSDEGRHFIENIRFSSNHLLGIINTILDLSKIEAGRMELEEQGFFLNPFINSMFEMLDVRARQKGVILVNAQAISTDTYVVMDKSKLSQIITNLVDNAIKFTPAGKPVRLRTAIGKRKLVLDIEDEGSGIAKGAESSIFEKFQQVGSEKSGGIGLGLAITRRLVELMQGQITVSSQPGEGTAMHVEIPLSSQPATVRPELLRENVDIRGLETLVIEDNPINQQVVQALLKALGTKAQIADCAESGLQLLDEQTYDLILMDLGLPGMDGIEATRLIRDLGHKIPVIALTADVFSAGKYQDLFDLYLTKPITREKLQDALMQIQAARIRNTD